MIMDLDVENGDVKIIKGDESTLGLGGFDELKDKVLRYVEGKGEEGEFEGGFRVEVGGDNYVAVYRSSVDNLTDGEMVLVKDVDYFESIGNDEIDKLTGLEGKGAFLDEVREQLRGKGIYQVYVFNIDNLRNLNDVFGRDKVDLLLKDIVERILYGVVSNYKIYRIEGDTFGIVREGREEEKFLKNVYDLFGDYYTVNDKHVYMTISLGYVSSEDVEEGLRAKDVYDNALVALNGAKAGGKDRWVKFSDKLKDRSRRELEMEYMIREALRENQFYLNLQPQYYLNGGVGLKGAEALIRWVHPEKGFISPGEFIPVAEKSGLIVKIGEWVVEKVCSIQREWLDEGLEVRRIDVNIGADHFKEEKFVENILAVLDKYDLDSKYLGLEITEGSVANNAEDMIEKLDRLKRAGLTISIDDFGTGYSSLSYLNKFSIDTLKIDQSFVFNLKDKGNFGIVKAIINMAKSLDLGVIAEGVETEEMRNILYELDCRDMQGYLFSKPVTEDEYKDILLGEMRVF